MKVKIPVVLCEVVDNLHWKFWCPFCQVWHVHSSERGHRVAHCGSAESPFYDKGYILSLKPTKKRTYINQLGA